MSETHPEFVSTRADGERLNAYSWLVTSEARGGDDRRILGRAGVSASVSRWATSAANREALAAVTRACLHASAGPAPR